MRLLIVTVNYRTASMTLDAVRAAYRELGDIPDGRIAVVDNASGDGSTEQIARAIADEGLGDRVELIASDHNGGFGYGNNLAIRPALASSDPPEYVYLLNSDAFPDPGSIKRLIDYMDAHPRVGIAGSYVHGTDGTPHRTAFRFPTAASELETSVRLGVLSELLRGYIVAFPIPEETCDVDWVAGASMIIRRGVLEEVGLFDEEFFLYFEETDLCRRARDAGWATAYVRESSVAHIGSASTGIDRSPSRMPRYWFDSRQHYFLKTHGRSYLWKANTARLVGSAVWQVRRRVEGKPRVDPPGFIRDFVSHAFRS